MKQKTTQKNRRRYKYETPEELRAAVEKYFESCAGAPAFDKYGRPIMKRNGEQRRTGETPPTITGLSHFLGYKDRRSFYQQRDRGPEFDDIVLHTRSRIEEFYERALYDNDTYKGATFMLSMCFGWKKRDAEPPQDPATVNIINRPQKSIMKSTENGSCGADPAARRLRIDLMN